MNQNVLLIFAKYPEAGKVKTRLAQTVGSVEAARWYRLMVETVVRKTAPEGEYRRVLYFDPPEKENDFTKWFPLLEMKPQCGGGLGQRMFVAFQESLRHGSGRVVLIGTDCIDVDRSLILKAFDDLEKADLVLGPAKDGGYYLIGCRQVYPELFTGIDWSTECVFAQTMKKAKALKFNTAFLPQLEDIDTGGVC